MGIGTNVPASSAILDLTSSSKGFLPPRMTAGSMAGIGTPVEGLMLYNSSAGRPYFFNGSVWSPLADDWGTQTASTSGPIMGNGTGANPLRLADGTMPGQVWQWNGASWTLAMASANLWATDGTNIWRASGAVGIGLAAPVATLDVQGSVAFRSSILNISTSSYTLDPANRSFVLLNPSTDTEIYLTNGQVQGQILILKCISASNRARFKDDPSGHNTNLAMSQTDLKQNDIIMLIWDTNNWFQLTSAANN